MQRITFGTSGWRGIMCEDFIFENVKVVTQAIADNVKASGEARKGIIVGYDSRFMGESFAREAARVLTGAGITTYLCIRDTPTPVIAFEILRRGTAGAINFTASHNPPEYNGIKFSPSWGGPALPQTTTDIENRANEMAGEICYTECSIDEAMQKGLLVEIDPMQAYLEDLATKVDFAAIAKLGTIAVNPLYGTARGYLAEPLKAHGVKVVQMNANRDPYFGGFPPEPSEKYIQDFIRLVQQDPSISLGIATDGDADRFGIVDSDGSFIEPNYIIALLLDYLVRVKGMTGGVGRSVATSHLVDAVAKLHGIEVFETPVGFKFIGELISQDKIIIGGEESAGLTIKGHVPEKDGILACLLVAEMVAREGKPVRALLEQLYEKVGRYLTKRVNITLSPELEEVFPERIAATPAGFAGVSVKQKVTVDGNKFILEDGSWLLFRKSGTEPVVRLYAEASNEARLQALLEAGREFIVGKA
ncbi:phosphoglucomutase/phosphomannomutase family protein [Citrifermentans bemidjiense Bem]|uniref:Phosphoglucomutase/phosphomannomutase family protein n=1 Tax=Citrifermentans bemidjiense (strain ATCC BAA-1014 / DSM 16622 / JCM 12645 / Bem) TaxID=404380 RepID=B5E8K0_CITBB|nr:phosphoglucomutase/phosphomannomutase family protein [Citrifermentans bemidjiense]ACH38585.1 phosphoglucomutase/phosphomannomutase family protein [Citrifermentans bemidjiense Bem]